MERDKNKSSSKRGTNKIKPTLFPSGDFIALGAKSSRDAPEPKPSPKPAHSSSSGISERKRESSAPSSSGSSLPTKKQKLHSSSSNAPVLPLPASRSVNHATRETSGVNERWDQRAADVEPSELLGKILEAEDQNDDERIEALMCGAVKNLRSSRAKPEASHYLSLLLIAKTRPHIFVTDLIVDAFCSLLKRDVTVNFKTKGNNLVSVLACNVLLSAYHETVSWPEEFVKTYVDDSLGERIWVDNEECKGFVNNIVTAFNTLMPPKSMMAPDLTFKPDACPSPPTIAPDDDETSSSSLSLECRESLDNIIVIPRFKHSRESIERYILDIVHDQLVRRQPNEVSRNMLRLLISTCGLSEIRLLVSQKLEMWLQNPKLNRPAQDLLCAVCMNCTQHNQQDVEVIAQLIKIRFKTKPVVNHFLLCMKELLKKHPENLSTVLKHAIYNELSNSRNPNNMQVLAIVFQHSQERAAKVLAEVFLDLLIKRDDYLRALRALLREIVRTVRFDLNFIAFADGIMQDQRSNPAFRELDAALKERMLFAVVDLVVLTIFVAVSPQVREAAAAYARGDKKEIAVLRNYQHIVTFVQCKTIWWLYSIVPKVFNSNRNDFVHCIHKVLFMEQLEHYYNKDNWPPEGERMILVRLAHEVPVLEDTLRRILIIGLSRDHPLNAPDALELTDHLIRRAANIYAEDCIVLKMDKEDFFDLVFTLCAYHHPENIVLPSGYQPPKLAIAELYWKAWIMLLISVAHNTTSFGLIAWEQYPTLRNFMEMCVTNYFTFPPATAASGEKADEIRARELQVSQMEKQSILEFESHLAAASTKVNINETNSLLLSKLIMMDPLGPARRPPAPVLDQLKLLNQSLKLGHLLCRSRKPDFLLDIIQRQGTSQSMPWLADLVESNEGSFNMLPVQCLCEFLLNDPPVSIDNGSSLENIEEDSKPDKTKGKKRVKPEHLLAHLQMLMYDENGNDSQPTREVLEYFLRRLSSQQISARNIAMKGLGMVLSPPNKTILLEDEEEVEEKEFLPYIWLLKWLPKLPHFSAVKALASLALRQACLVENHPPAVAAFVKYLALYSPMDNLQEISDLSLDMAQLIVERPTIINCIVPPPPNSSGCHSPFLIGVATIFIKYLRTAKMPSREAYAWSESQDHILVQWAGGEAATMHILVVHAMVILLTYGPPVGNQSYFNELLQTWFPMNSDPPQAFLVDTSEEALLLPDWLKLRMIRSTVELLVDAALKDLDPSQLVLFVQSFGIPVLNMSKLLMILDLAVEVDRYAVEQAIVDKSYMAQLVEVQHQRGANGGERFAHLLGEYENADKSASPTTMCVDSVNSTSVIQMRRASEKIQEIVPIEPSSMHSSIIKLFQLEEGARAMTATNTQEVFKGIQKSLSKDLMMKNDAPNISAFTDACYQITRGPFREAFAKSVLVKTNHSCVLFRLATANALKSKPVRSPLVEKLLDVCRSILVCTRTTKSPLTSILKQFMKGFDDACYDWAHSEKWRSLLEELVSSGSQWSTERVIEILREVERGNKHRLEEATIEIVRASMKQGTVKDLVGALASIIMEGKLNGENGPCHLFVDLITQLEPEIMGGDYGNEHRQILQRLLFAKDPSFKSGGAQESHLSFRPYLLALLTHQASWETLKQCIALVLSPQQATDTFKLDAAAEILDFLWACIHIPKIWQGKDKKKPKHHQDEDVLALEKDQLIRVADFIIAEACEKINVDFKNDKFESLKTEALDVSIAFRVPLLSRCCCQRKEVISAIVDHLLESIEKEKNLLYCHLVKQLLLQMYLSMPSILQGGSALHNILDKAETLRSGCSRLDVISHTLLISLATTDSSKNCCERMADLNLACRKLASTHPFLMLRQLPMIAVLLQGRVHLDYIIFRAQNHQALFSYVLGFLELLMPYIFMSEYSLDLSRILNIYLGVFLTYANQSQELLPIFNRLINFFQACMTLNPSSIRSCLQEHLPALQELPSVFLELGSFKSLLAGATWLHHKEESRSESGNAKETIKILETEEGHHNLSTLLEIWGSTQQPQGWSQTQLAPLLARLNQDGNFEDVMAALQDLDNLSNRKPNILDYFLDDLKVWIQNRNVNCRQMAFNLLIKHLKNKPGSAKQLVTAFLQCLENHEHDIIQTALHHLPDIVILAQEYASVLLQKAFAVGISTNINSCSQICETLLLLNVQTGS